WRPSLASFLPVRLLVSLARCPSAAGRGSRRLGPEPRRTASAQDPGTGRPSGGTPMRPPLHSGCALAHGGTHAPSAWPWDLPSSDVVLGWPPGLGSLTVARPDQGLV